MRFLVVIGVLSLMQMTFAVEVNYDLEYGTEGRYACTPLKLETTKPGTLIIEYTGEHNLGKFDSDVLVFNIKNQKTDYLPRGMTTKYENIEVLNVEESGVKAITRDDFKAMPKLTRLSFFNNKIDIIPNNCFADLVQLEILELAKNKIKTLPFKVFHFPN